MDQMPTQLKPKHIEWVDRWKGLLIFLVVLGHAVGTSAHMTNGAVQNVYEVLYRAIYVFHMPAFFVLAGMTFNSSNGGWGAFLYKKFRRLMVPYYCFGLFSIVVFLATYSLFRVSAGGTDAYYGAKATIDWWLPFIGLLHGGNWPNGEGLRMNAVLWFLPCLFSTEVLYRVVNQIMLRRKSVRIGLLVACAVLAFVIKANGLKYWPFGLDKVPYFLFFFLLGTMCGLLPEWRIDERKRWMLLGLCVTCSVGFVLWMGRMPELYVAWYNWRWYLIFLCAAVLGIALSIMFAQLLRTNIWQRLGTMSLGIMLVHKFILVVLQFKLAGIKVMIRRELIISLSTTVCMAVLTIVIAYYFCSIVILRFAPFSLGVLTRHNSEMK